VVIEHCERCKEMNVDYCELSFDLQGCTRGIPVSFIMEGARGVRKKDAEKVLNVNLRKVLLCFSGLEMS
jgi:hypothetical protein